LVGPLSNGPYVRGPYNHIIIIYYYIRMIRYPLAMLGNTYISLIEVCISGPEPIRYYTMKSTFCQVKSYFNIINNLELDIYP
jgi:hypothetical protein